MYKERKNKQDELRRLKALSEQAGGKSDALNARIAELREELFESDPTLAVWFTPQAIRDHFESEGELGEWVDKATLEQLVEVGQGAMHADTLWELFHELLVEQVYNAIEQSS